MNYKILTIPPFDKQLKRLVKKYPSLKNEYEDLIDSLEQNPNQGTPLGEKCFKIRISIASKGKGKSGGARVITNILISEELVFLLNIYDKSEKEDLTDNELRDLLNFVDE
jgi:mRNA-degrading endonuclease RelE of RelBE toxin-antitoxin system